jgi:hypothetical protein
MRYPLRIIEPVLREQWAENHGAGGGTNMDNTSENRSDERIANTGSPTSTSSRAIFSSHDLAGDVPQSGGACEPSRRYPDWP